MYRVALVSMPFAAVDYPSLALGLFRSRLQQEGIPCDIHYLNIPFAEMIGFDNFNYLITTPPAYFAAEQLFAESAFGPSIPSDQAYYDEAGVAAPARQHLQRLKSFVEPFLHHCLISTAWDQYDLIGFTSLFEQNLASISLARRLKWYFPKAQIVFGGPNFEAIMGETFHRRLSFIDFVCSGEADDTFPELIKRLAYHHPIHDLPGIVYRRGSETVATRQAPMMSDLDRLPMPDYSDYFQRVRQIALPPWVDPCVLIETARGCWWGEKNHCTFCGLNSLSMKYRSKTSDRAVAEVVEMKHKYDIRFVRVVDNILNHDFFDDFLPALAERKLGVTIFFEVKANLRKPQIKTLRDAGVTIVQAGIESLSTNSLKLMRKGSTSLMNIQTLKWCKEYGVRCDWNLIYGFPGEGPADFRRCLEIARVSTYLDPPTGCGPIRLDRFSPNFDKAAELGFRNIRPLKYYKYLFPFAEQDLFDVAYYFDFDYVAEIDNGGQLPALNEAIIRWKQSQDQLYAVETGSRVTICDSRPVATASHTRLTGVERLVFELCDSITTPRRILQRLSSAYGLGVEEAEIRAILTDFLARHLMLTEDDRYLSLPVLTYTPEHDRVSGRVERMQQRAVGAENLAPVAA